MIGQGVIGADGRRRAIDHGWAPLLALAATLALGAGETGSLSQAVNGIQRTFHVSNATVALLPVAMAVIGVLGAVPFGFMADSRRRTYVLGGAMLAWTACMGLNGLAWSFWVLLAFRLGVGFAEASSSASISLIGDYFPVSERAGRMGLYQAGSIVGSLIGFLGGGVAVAVGGWRWAFWFWVPLGMATVAYLLAQPEPRRGIQDADFEADRAAAASSTAASFTEAGTTAASFKPPSFTGQKGAMAFAGRLPPPRRVGTVDYDTAGVTEIMRELFRIPSMWWALLALTLAQLITAALSFWAIPFFERVDHLSPVAAGAFTGILLPAAMLGVLGGGAVADRLNRRGVLNARIYVVVAGSALSGIGLPIGFGTHNLVLSGVFLLIGGCGVTLPIAPSEALFNDVVVASLRGRAASVRSMVRAASSAGSLIVGALADHLGSPAANHAAGLQAALVIFAPVCGLAGIAFIFARRSYGHDMAFACAEAARLHLIEPPVAAPGP
ncbi:MAG: MFS transporter [Acidimicrobiales bacterium]